MIEELRKLQGLAIAAPWEAQEPAFCPNFGKAKIWPLKIEGRLYNFAMIKQHDAELIATMRNTLPHFIELYEAAKERSEYYAANGYTTSGLEHKVAMALAKLEGSGERG